MNCETKLMLEPEAVELLAEYNIEYPQNKFVTTKEQACEEGAKIGYPIVMKIVSHDIVHKSDAGAVITDINSKKETEKAYEKIMDSVNRYNPNADIKGLFLCKQAEPGKEVIVGTVVDAVFGPTVMFGLGGIFVELLEDVTFRVCPIDKKEALEMIQEIKGYKIFKGVRGQAVLDVDSLANLIVKISKLAAENEHIKEIDLNPIRVYEDKVMALDARILNY